MPSITGINHLSLHTPDLDRLTAFYRELFDARIAQLAPTPWGGRVCILRIGDGVALNIFEAGATEETEETPQPSASRLRPGPINHFGISAVDAEAFWALRSAMMARGCSDGQVTDFGPVLGVRFTDPDGVTVELDLVLDPTLAGGHSPVPYTRPVAEAGTR